MSTWLQVILIFIAAMLVLGVIILVEML